MVLQPMVIRFLICICIQRGMTNINEYGKQADNSETKTKRGRYTFRIMANQHTRTTLRNKKSRKTKKMNINFTRRD